VLMIIACTGSVLFVLGLAGSVLSLVCRFPPFNRFLDNAFENSPLGREEVQQLNTERLSNTVGKPVPHRAK